METKRSERPPNSVAYPPVSTPCTSRPSTLLDIELGLNKMWNRDEPLVASALAPLDLHLGRETANEGENSVLYVPDQASPPLSSRAVKKGYVPVPTKSP